MSRPALEVADIFRNHGAAWRRANAGHVSLDQLKVMSAIERCRTAALGGHVARCEDCAHTVIAYNSCRNRHCPKCRRARSQWRAGFRCPTSTGNEDRRPRRAMSSAGLAAASPTPVGPSGSFDQAYKISRKVVWE